MNELVIHPEIRILELCAGTGQLGTAVELACELTGIDAGVVCHVEREAAAAAAIVARMEAADLSPALIWDDVATFDGAAWRGQVDILAAGYPCQDFSYAGKRAGMQGTRGAVWEHVRRIVEECQPRTVFFENVRGHVTLGYDVVCDDLRGLGYSVVGGVFTAAEVGAPHKRERLFILGELDNVQGVGRQERIHQGDGGESKRGGEELVDSDDGRRRDGSREVPFQASAELEHGSSEQRRQSESGNTMHGSETGCTEFRESGRGGSEPSDGSQGGDARSPDPAGSRSIMADSDEYGCSGFDVGGGVRDGEQERRNDVDGCGEELGDAHSGERHEGREGDRGGSISEPGGQLGDAESAGRSGGQAEHDANGRLQGVGDGLPIFPPARNDWAGWATVAELDPTRMPAIESGVSVVAHGDGDTIPNSELLRLGGNAVVALQAAYAFITLTACIGDDQ